MRVRPLMCLLAALLLALSPTVMPMPAAAHADHVADVHCPDHAPPPPSHCPDRGTAKHAAGLCCMMMSHAPCLLSDAAMRHPPKVFAGVPARVADDLTGYILQKDPPPPRV